MLQRSLSVLLTFNCVVGALVGCSGSTPSTEPVDSEAADITAEARDASADLTDASTDGSDAEKVAMLVLTAIREKNLEAFTQTFGKNNREQIASYGKDKQLTMDDIFTGWRRAALDSWDGKIEGVRYRHYEGTAVDSYEANVKFGESDQSDEIYVVNLVWEEGTWRFEDIHSPPLDLWQEGKETLDPLPSP